MKKNLTVTKNFFGGCLRRINNSNTTIREDAFN